MSDDAFYADIDNAIRALTPVAPAEELIYLPDTKQADAEKLAAETYLSADRTDRSVYVTPVHPRVDLEKADKPKPLTESERQLIYSLGLRTYDTAASMHPKMNWRTPIQWVDFLTTMVENTNENQRRLIFDQAKRSLNTAPAILLAMK
jgi:hypothetical protein